MQDQSLPFDAPVAPSLPRKRGQVPKTSVLAYQATDAKGRAAHVTQCLAAMTRWQAPLTSAELARQHWCNVYGTGKPSTDCLLYVRRGLSDAKKLGLVVQGEKRICRVAGTLAVTWKVATR